MKQSELKELSVLLIDEAKRYRNGFLTKKFIPLFNGELITEAAIMALISPFLTSISGMLNKSTMKNLSVGLDEYAPEAMNHMFVNPHMHNGDRTGIFNQNNAEAILFMFVVIACRPFYLDLHSDILAV